MALHRGALGGRAPDALPGLRATPARRFRPPGARRQLRADQPAGGPLARAAHPAGRRAVRGPGPVGGARRVAGGAPVRGAGLAARAGPGGRHRLRPWCPARRRGPADRVGAGTHPAAPLRPGHHDLRADARAARGQGRGVDRPRAAPQLGRHGGDPAAAGPTTCAGALRPAGDRNGGALFGRVRPQAGAGGAGGGGAPARRPGRRHHRPVRPGARRGRAAPARRGAGQRPDRGAGAGGASERPAQLRRRASAAAERRGDGSGPALEAGRHAGQRPPGDRVGRAG